MTGSFQAGNRVAKSTASERVRGLVLNGETYRESSQQRGGLLVSLVLFAPMKWKCTDAPVRQMYSAPVVRE